MARKVFAEVTARFDTEGKITLLSLLWEDGTVYEIDRVPSMHMDDQGEKENRVAVHQPT